MSANTQHTPGPWREYGGRIEAKGRAVAALISYGSDDPEREANARLIAAAPELLAALVGLEDCAAACREFVATPAARAWIKQARSAIAEATEGSAAA